MVRTGKVVGTDGKTIDVCFERPEMCAQCGACMDACDEDAIVRAGAVRPRCPAKPIPCKAR